MLVLVFTDLSNLPIKGEQMMFNLGSSEKRKPYGALTVLKHLSPVPIMQLADSVIRS